MNMTTGQEHTLFQFKSGKIKINNNNINNCKASTQSFARKNINAYCSLIVESLHPHMLTVVLYKACNKEQDMYVAIILTALPSSGTNDM
jgi:hypothetical protein